MRLSQDMLGGAGRSENRQDFRVSLLVDDPTTLQQLADDVEAESRAAARHATNKYNHTFRTSSQQATPELPSPTIENSSIKSRLHRVIAAERTCHTGGTF
jgi:hypothetical protein